MKDRIALLIKAKNFTSAQFADEVGVQKSGISHIISGRNNPSLDFVQKLLQRFPEVSMDWLILGKGPMFNNESPRPILAEKTLFNFAGSGLNEPDLFSTENIAQNQPLEKELSSESDGFKLFNSKTELPPEIQRESEPVPSEIKIPAKVAQQIAGNEKSIEKILFFYTDKTFVEYTPGN